MAANFCLLTVAGKGIVIEEQKFLALFLCVTVNDTDFAILPFF